MAVCVCLPEPGQMHVLWRQTCNKDAILCIQPSAFAGITLRADLESVMKDVSLCRCVADQCSGTTIM
jgi:hypothetical protein